VETDDFEWDDAKAAKNFINHRVRFEDATFAFDDPAAVDFVDSSEHYDEVRYKLIASAGPSLLVVIYTMCEERIRIISAREAETHERAQYRRGRSDV
jgi:uncharacterized protein